MTNKRPGRTSLTFLLIVLMPIVAWSGRLDSLQILEDKFPRVFFFRQAEGLAAQRNNTYANWDRTFGRLMGIEGKVLDEEVLGREIRNPEFFTRFKKDHPRQLVLLHFNGNARDPRWRADRFFAGHWIYYNGAGILSDVLAESGPTTIRVKNATLFRVGIGRYRNRNEDIGLCELGPDGKPDWNKSEQVRLIAVNVKAGTIRLERGCYGTKPRAFRARRAYAASHVTEGPWGDKNNLLWFHNYSTRCPRDSEDRNCADRLVDHLAALFDDSGPLAAFDGLEFDVLHNRPGLVRGNRGPDCDADGKADAGIIDGMNTYGIGVIEFCRQLRRRLGDDRIIQADGANEHNQRAFGILNGIESEGWPHLSDHEILDFSGGLNRHLFWDSRARKPVFNYINHKCTAPGGKPGRRKVPDVPYATHRLVFAAAVFTNAAICYSYLPPKDRDGRFGIWDEFRMGTEDRLGYLGRPLAPAIRLAKSSPDLLESAGSPVTDRLLSRFGSSTASASIENTRLKITAQNPNANRMTFALKGIPCKGPDLTVFLTAAAEAMKDYPPEYARLMHVSVPTQDRRPAKSDRHMTWVDTDSFESAFYFPNIKTERIDLQFSIEGAGPLYISAIRAFARPDVIYRPFANGVVLANPASHPYTFDLAKLLPRRTFRRLKGSPTQDPVANNGAPVIGPVELAAKEGLFLVDR